MNAPVNRRSLLTAALAAPALAVVPVAAVAQTETPIAAMFREWKRLSAIINDQAATDEDVDQACDDRGALEIDIAETKAETATDILMKVCAITDFGFYGNAEHGLKGAWAEAHALIAA